MSLLQRGLIDGWNLATTARLWGAHDYSARSNLRPVVFCKRSPSSHDNAAPRRKFGVIDPSERGKIGRREWRSADGAVARSAEPDLDGLAVDQVVKSTSAPTADVFRSI